jgi:hypothetical protein
MANIVLPVACIFVYGPSRSVIVSSFNKRDALIHQYALSFFSKLILNRRFQRLSFHRYCLMLLVLYSTRLTSLNASFPNVGVGV